MQYNSGDEINLVYVYGSSPNNFTCQFQDDISKLYALMEEIAEYVSPQLLNPPSRFRVGDPLLAKFSKDQLWYRAEVLGYDDSKDCVEVLFVDYGNSEVLPVADTAVIPQHFMTLKKQAATYRLVTNSGVVLEQWPDHAFAKFEELMENCEGVVATVKDLEGNYVAVALTSDACMDFAESIQ